MELAKELFNIFLRIISIVPLVHIITLFMGKRSIGELPVFDFLVIITLGAVVGADIADPKINHIHTAFAIIVIGIFQFLVSKWAIKNRKLGRLVTFEPTVVVKDGQFLIKNLRKIRYSVDNILQMLREKDIFDVQHVEIAIVEANGRLTVHKVPEEEEVTIKDLGLTKIPQGIALPVVIEGKLYNDVLQSLDLNKEWFLEQITKQGVKNLEEIFYASINQQHQIHISYKQYMTSQIPPIHH